MRFETIGVHAGAATDPSTGAVAAPIHLSTTFEHAAGGPPLHGFKYIREENPTQSRLEEALAAIEGGAGALVFASGVAAGATYLQALPPSSHVILPDDVYQGFRLMATELLPRWGLEVSVVDMTDVAEVRAAMRPDTRVVWAETPSNPLLKIVDLGALASVAHQAGAELLVDNTFATPALQRPLDRGADVVLHSTTKYVGGHSDAQGGALVFARRGDRVEEMHRIRTLLGCVASPFNSWVALRGLRTLACRMEQHSSSAMLLAQMLEQHPAVERVYYPGLPSHAGHAIARHQMRRFGGMLSFLVRGGRRSAIDVASRVELFINATSLGGAESLIEHRASQEGARSVAPDNLLRCSVGLEHPDDLIADLAQALDHTA